MMNTHSNVHAFISPLYTSSNSHCALEIIKELYALYQLKEIYLTEHDFKDKF